MSDSNPQQLSLRPTLSVRRLPKKVLYGVATLLMGLFCSIAYFVSQDAPDRNKSDTAHQLAQPDTKPVIHKGEEKGGKARESKGPESPLAGTTEKLPETVPPPPRKSIDPVLREELMQLRKYKAEMARQALQAPLNVQVSSQQQRPQVMPSSYAQQQGGETETDSRRAAEVTRPQASEYDPAAQKDKEDFERRSRTDGQWILNAVRSPGARYELKSGTILPGIMISGINSDLPGTLIAQVSQHVYDTATGRHLLIPQGSRLYGRYDSRVIMGQERVLVGWNRVILPDGSSLDLGSMPGVDQGGYAGFNDSVNNHYMRLFGSALIMSMITGGMAYSVDALSDRNNSGTNSNPSVQDEMGSALATTMGQSSMNMLNRNMNISPTLEIRPGYRFNLIVVKDITFDAPYRPWR
ncbi:MAG: conjugal transfer protein TrbI [Desulfovibrio sp.]|jgi:type IV secretion system protein VirB10|nr:conjugal transfer protein TrbI [Desulfovibrio sp.]